MLNTDLAALAHLGERQTEVHFESRIHCDFWRYCVRSTEAAFLLSFLQVSFLHRLALGVYVCQRDDIYPSFASIRVAGVADEKGQSLKCTKSIP